MTKRGGRDEEGMKEGIRGEEVTKGGGRDKGGGSDEEGRKG